MLVDGKIWWRCGSEVDQIRAFPYSRRHFFFFILLKIIPRFFQTQNIERKSRLRVYHTVTVVDGISLMCCY